MYYIYIYVLYSKQQVTRVDEMYLHTMYTTLVEDTDGLSERKH